MKKSLLIIAAIAVAMLMTLAGCGGGEEEAVQTEPAEETTVSEDIVEYEDNPIMDFVGPYTCDRATVNIEAYGPDGVKATVLWASSASEYSEWVMSGTFDEDTKTFEYHDCVKTETVYDDDGSIKSEEEVYTGGHGFMFFEAGDKLTLTWQDDQEHAADDMVFTFDPDMA